MIDFGFHQVMAEEQKYVVVYGLDDGRYHYLSTNGKWYGINSSAEPYLLTAAEIEQSQVLNLGVCMTVEEFEIVRVMEPEEITSFKDGIDTIW